jgi:peptidoglycan/xylan/chitin deacetylase (PgdA/CDA1 family)
MNKHSLCTIGAHTYEHFGLRFSNEEIVRKDIKRNKDQLESILNNTVEHFAFPYGTHYSVGNREYQIAHQAGFKTAVVTFSSPIYNYHANKLYSLPRINLVQN